MKYIFIGPIAQAAKRRIIYKKLEFATYILFACLVPLFVIYVGFKSEIFTSASYDIVKPVALLTTSRGTGSAILTGKTRFLTAAHVVEKGKVGDIVELDFEKADDLKTQAKVIFIGDRINLGDEYDFAVLELTDRNAMNGRVVPINLGSSASAKLNDRVIVVGYPAAGFSLTNGVISNDKVNKTEFFLVDAGAWPGNSGGALINENAQKLTGLVVARTIGNFSGRTYAIKLDFIISKLKAEGLDLTQ